MVILVANDCVYGVDLTNSRQDLRYPTDDMHSMLTRCISINTISLVRLMAIVDRTYQFPTSPLLESTPSSYSLVRHGCASLGLLRLNYQLFDGYFLDQPRT